MLFTVYLQKIPVWLIKLIIHLGALLPVIFLYFQAFNDQLGADPVEVVIHFTGIGALNLLLLSLLSAPLSKKFKLPTFVKVRRLLGLYSFFYALLHLTNFLAFEVQFDFTLFFNEIIKRPYITVGMAALTILTLLAVTSITTIKKRMGKGWQKLHSYVYLAVTLVVIHFYWSVKSEIIEPTIYILAAIALLLLRLKKIKAWISSPF